MKDVEPAASGGCSMAKGDKIIRMVNMGKTFHTSSGDVNALDDINLDILELSLIHI